jgi:trk system potassium uptake protein TrkH
MEVLLLRVGGLSWFDSFCHTFTTLSAGGFSTLSASVGGFDSLYVEIVITVFMMLASINFALHFRAARGDVLSYFRDPECRVFVVFWLAVCAFLSFDTWGRVYPTLGEAVRRSVFQCTSVVSTTGFATADFNQWPNASRLMLVILMFTGACAGSTAGGMKIVRVLVVLKTMLRELRTHMRPQAIVQVKLGAKPVDPDIVTNISTFFAIFLLVFGAGTFLMTFFTPDLVTAGTSVIATLGNIGPGLGRVGPAETFAFIPAPGKLLLTLFMLLGRLELFTVLVLFMPNYWRR